MYIYLSLYNVHSKRNKNFQLISVKVKSYKKGVNCIDTKFYNIQSKLWLKLYDSTLLSCPYPIKHLIK